MLRTTTFACALLLSSLSGANAKQISYLFQRTTAATIRDLSSLIDVTQGQSSEPGFLPNAPVRQSTVLLKREPLSVPLAIGAPEPGPFLLLGSGLVLIGLIRRACHSRQSATP